MKKFKILLCLSMVLALIAAPFEKSQAQGTALISPVYGNTKDTVTDAGTKVIWLKVDNNRATVTLSFDAVRLTGTLAGTISPIVSNNGSTFYYHRGLLADDTAVVLTNAATAGKSYVMPPGFNYYGFRWVGSGTQSSTIVGTLTARKPND